MLIFLKNEQIIQFNSYDLDCCLTHLYAQELCDLP